LTLTALPAASRKPMVYPAPPCGAPIWITSLSASDGAKAGPAKYGQLPSTRLTGVSQTRPLAVGRLKIHANALHVARGDVAARRGPVGRGRRRLCRAAAAPAPATIRGQRAQRADPAAVSVRRHGVRVRHFGAPWIADATTGRVEVPTAGRRVV
jgi:hypothetical protein